MGEVYQIIVSGKVQGVGFRYYTHGAANKVGVAGWARNLSTGEVEVLARIPEGKKSLFIELLRKGPPASRVRDIQVRLAEETLDCPMSGFSIRH